MVEVYHSSIRGLDGEPKVLLLVIFLLTQGLIQNPQKSIDVYSLISVDLNTFLSLRLALLRVAWPSNIWRATQEYAVVLSEIMQKTVVTG